jgi:hypothetical protein
MTAIALLMLGIAILLTSAIVIHDERAARAAIAVRCNDRRGSRPLP